VTLKPLLSSPRSHLQEGAMNFHDQKPNVEQDIKELKDQMQRSHEEQFSRITEMVIVTLLLLQPLLLTLCVPFGLFMDQQ